MRNHICYVKLVSQKRYGSHIASKTLQNMSITQGSKVTKSRGYVVFISGVNTATLRE